jgi:hypothetical protein
MLSAIAYYTNPEVLPLNDSQVPVELAGVPLATIVDVLEV